MASNGYPQQGESAPPQNTSAGPTSGNTQTPDHVGWCFVKQYYTVLSESPDKLNLFYHKGSSLVWGTEGEVQNMIQGRHEIIEQIKSLNFKNCRVRVTNVDSQASAGNGILIQVMGAMTNDEGPAKRFVQTFFLAEQQNGYYVLNDIFRYIAEEEEEEGPFEENAQQESLPEEEQEVVPEADIAPAEEIPVEETVKETEETVVPIEAEPEPEPAKPEEPITIAPAVPEIPVAVPILPEVRNGTPAVEAAETETTPEEPEVTPETVEETVPAPSVEPTPKVESTSATPEQPTPVATPPPQQPLAEKPPASAPAPTPAPAAPQKFSWASIVGSSTKSAAPVAIAAPQATQPPQAIQPTQVAASIPAATPTTPTSTSGGSGQGWQSVSDTSRRHTRPPLTGDLQNQVFVRSVTENVDINGLKDALSKFGTVKGIEQNKPKNCAIVEFDNSSSVKAAIAASPLRVGNRDIPVEERKAPLPRTNGPGYGQRNSPGGQRGDVRQGQGRGGYPRAEGRFDGRDSRDGGRGGPRGGSGRGFPTRGRGNAAATN